MNLTPFIQPGQLARLVDRLRFLTEHELKGGQADIREKGKRLLAQLDDHPLAMNFKAFEILPESALPAPSPSFGPVAQLFSEGKATEALALAATTVHKTPHPRSWVNYGDLQVLHKDLPGAEASYRRALEELGKTPPIELRFGRIEALHQRWDAAHRKAISALSDNPLYGSARFLWAESANAIGRLAVNIPISERVYYGPAGNRLYDNSLSEAAREAWRCWADIDQQLGATETPPKQSAYEALIASWRQNRNQNSDPGYIDPSQDADNDLQILESIDARGLLGPYLWSIGLGHSNADVFRSWITSNRGRMTQFWESLSQSGKDR